jgi:hypothetical protein
MKLPIFRSDELCRVGRKRVRGDGRHLFRCCE